MASREMATASHRPSLLSRAASRVVMSFRSAGSLFSSTSRGAYEAASRSVRMSGMDRGDYGPNGFLGELATIRRRSRFLVRNNGYAHHALNQLTANVVGYGIKPLCRFPDLQARFDAFAETCDARGRADFYSLQAQAFHGMAEAGDTFTRMIDTPAGLKLKLDEADIVPETMTQVSPAVPAHHVVGGVERDDLEAVHAFWMYRMHPLDSDGRIRDMQAHRIPVADVCQMYLPVRAGDVRGVPWLVRALVKAGSLDRYDDSELRRKEKTAGVAGFFHRPAEADAAGQNPKEAVDDAGVLQQEFESGVYVDMPPGYDVRFAEIPDVGGQYEPFMRQQLQAIAISVGLIYEQLTHDWRGSSDRTYRAAMLEANRLVDAWQYHVVIHQWCKPIWRRFVASEILEGRWTPPEGAVEADYMNVEWTPPPKGYIHPVQEVAAWAEAIRLGITSRKRVASQLGEDVATIDQENARDLARARENGLRYTAYVGADEEPAPATENAAKIAEIEAEEVADQVGRLKVSEAA